MAIAFCRVEPISRKSGGNTVRSSAYQQRAKMRDEVNNKRFDFRERESTVLRKSAYQAHNALVDERTGQRHDFKRPSHPTKHRIKLPAGAGERFRDAATLWNAVEGATKRKDAFLGREMVLAMPNNPEVTAEMRSELVDMFADKYFVFRGLAVQIDEHEPHPNSKVAAEAANPHAHLLIPDWYIDGDRLGAKARDYGPEIRRVNGRPTVVESEGWPQRWTDFQNDYFKRSGLDITVDPISENPGQHLGPIRFRDSESEKARLADVAAKRTEREKAALDQVVAKAHEPQQPAKPQREAEVVELRTKPAREWFAVVVEGWHAPRLLRQAQDSAQSEAPPARHEDHLAHDLLKAITAALKRSDAQEQLEELAAGVDRAVFMHGGNSDEAPSALAKSLMRVVTSALSVAEPEQLLVKGTAEAIRRHDLRQRQQEPAQSPAQPQDTRKPVEAAIVPETAEQRHTGRQRAREQREQQVLDHTVKAREVQPDDREDRAKAFLRKTAEAGRSDAPRSAVPDPRLIKDRDEVKRLQKEAYLDRNQWARPLTITDVAIELSPVVGLLADARNKLLKEAKEAREERRRWGRARDANMAAEKYRLQEMGVVRRFLHRNGLKPDKMLAEYEHGDWEAQTRLAELRRADADRRPKITKAVEAYKAALAKVLPRAEAEMSRRITVASEARRQLDGHYAALGRSPKPLSPAEWALRREQDALERRQKPDARQTQAEAFVRKGVEAGREQPPERESERHQERPRRRLRL